MSENILNNVTLHHDKNQFISAIDYTAAETGFAPELIEKDYFCTVTLTYLAQRSTNSLVFKGGTLLAKAYAGFYRLSEDLDFTIPVPATSTRKQRSNRVKPFKSIINDIVEHFPNFYVKKMLTGSNESRQYNAELQYDSVISKKKGRILIDIGLRGELLMAPILTKLRTVLQAPFTGEYVVMPFTFHSLSKYEAYAEKIKAALTRNRLAIRDFYDIHIALENKIINFNDENLIAYVIQKIQNSNENLIEFNNVIEDELHRKILTELVQTLRNRNVGTFNLNKVLGKLQDFSKRVF